MGVLQCCNTGDTVSVVSNESSLIQSGRDGILFTCISLLSPKSDFI